MKELNFNQVANVSGAGLMAAQGWNNFNDVLNALHGTDFTKSDILALGDDVKTAFGEWCQDMNMDPEFIAGQLGWKL